MGSAQRLVSLRRLKLALLRFGLTAFARVAEKVVPKQSDLVVFGAMNGGAYGDNSAHLFEWMLENRPGVRSVWITRNRSVRKALEKRRLPVRLARSMRGVIALMQARVGVFTNSLTDLAAYPEMVPASIQLVALRHGQPVKRIRFARAEHKLDAAEAAVRKREGALIRYAASTSEFVSDIQEECLRIGRQKHVVTGYPRNDHLLEVPADYARDWSAYLDGTKPRKVVLYALTWRYGRAAPRFFPFDDFDRNELIELLRRNDAVLLLRPHVRDLDIYPELRCTLEGIANDGQIRLGTHREIMDVNTMLPFVDVMISDYSSIYHDYLLLDRAMLFTPYDYEEFERQQGFLYDYFETLPGPAVYTFSEFCDELGAALSGDDRYAERRAALTEKIHTYRDAESSRRVSDLVTRTLQEA